MAVREQGDDAGKCQDKLPATRVNRDAVAVHTLRPKGLPRSQRGTPREATPSRMPREPRQLCQRHLRGVQVIACMTRELPFARVGSIAPVGSCGSISGGCHERRQRRREKCGVVAGSVCYHLSGRKRRRSMACFLSSRARVRRSFPAKRPAADTLPCVALIRLQRYARSNAARARALAAAKVPSVRTAPSSSPSSRSGRSNSRSAQPI